MDHATDDKGMVNFLFPSYQIDKLTLLDTSVIFLYRVVYICSVIKFLFHFRNRFYFRKLSLVANV